MTRPRPGAGASAPLLALLVAALAGAWAVAPLRSAPPVDAECFAAAAERGGPVGPFLGLEQGATWRPLAELALPRTPDPAGVLRSRAAGAAALLALAAAVAAVARRLGAGLPGAVAAGAVAVLSARLPEALTSPGGVAQALSWAGALTCLAFAGRGRRSDALAAAAGAVALAAGDAALALPAALALLRLRGARSAPSRTAVLAWTAIALAGLGVRALRGWPGLAVAPPALPAAASAELVLVAALLAGAFALGTRRAVGVALALAAVGGAVDLLAPGDAWGPAPAPLGASVGLGLALGALAPPGCWGRGGRAELRGRALALLGPALAALLIVPRLVEAREVGGAVAAEARLLAAHQARDRELLERVYGPPDGAERRPVLDAVLPRPDVGLPWGAPRALLPRFGVAAPVWPLAPLDPGGPRRPYARFPVDDLVWTDGRSARVGPLLPVTGPPGPWDPFAGEEVELAVWGELLGHLDVVVYTPQGYAARALEDPREDPFGDTVEPGPTGVEMPVRRRRLRVDLLEGAPLEALRRADALGFRRAYLEVRVADHARGVRNRVVASSDLHALVWDVLGAAD